MKKFAILVAVLFATAAFAVDAPKGPVVLESAKQGNVTFNHSKHAQLKCEQCHKGTPGKIGAMDKDTAHKMCSDCHNTDAASPAAQGPHGSAAPFMLRDFGAGKPPVNNWPNVTLTNALTTTPANQSWCQNCHLINATVTNAVHTKNSTHEGHQCFACHVVIPHGSKMSRLMACNTNMPARYAYQGDLNNTLMGLQGHADDMTRCRRQSIKR